MSAQQTDRETDTDDGDGQDPLPSPATLAAMPDDLRYLGTDADGRDHYCLAVRNVVWGRDANGHIDPESIQRVPSVGAYVEHVRDVTGWRTVRYEDGGLAAVLARIVRSVGRKSEGEA